MIKIALAGVFFATFAFAQFNGRAEVKPPNVLFILVDDLGWMDLGCNGSTYYQTPNIDALAKTGTRYTHAYSASPLCSPTRASIMTGLYPGRLGFWNAAGHLPQVVLEPNYPPRAKPYNPMIDPQSVTRLKTSYPNTYQAFKQAGYVIGHFGKWHLGSDPYLPTNFGADVNLPGGSYPGPPRYYSPYKMAGFPDGPAGEFIDDRLEKEIEKFLKENKGKPFFINYWMFSVHGPFTPDPALLEKYKTIPEGSKQRCPTMATMIERMDRSVGALMKALKEMDLMDNTLIVFTSDNGGVMYEKVDGVTVTDNSPLKGGKAMLDDGGSRVPLIVSWKGKVAEGETSDQMTSSIDYYPTFLQILGQKQKEGAPLDGVSLLDLWTQKTPLNRDTLFCHFPYTIPKTGNQAGTYVVSGSWKLIRRYGRGENRADKFDLFNIKDDIGEAQDLSQSNPEKVKELASLLEKNNQETGQLLPKLNPNYDPSAPLPDPNAESKKAKTPPDQSPPTEQ